MTLLLVAGCTTEELDPLVVFDLPDDGAAPVALPSRIAFGSCSDPALPLDLLDVATGLEPDVFVWLGDNVYADTVNPAVMRKRYQELADAEAFIRLRRQAQLIATWDDHDYGQNDAGRDYPMRAASREIFLEFWEEPADSARHGRPGIYTSYRYQDAGNTLQVIVLDTRFNRDGLALNDGSGKNDYVPNQDPTRTLLGEPQWAWLERQLGEPADLRILASSIQLGHSYNGYESWTLFPHELDRLTTLIRDTQAEGVFVISGDVHWGEVSRLDIPGGYAITDVTSSGINQDWPFIESNDHRIAGPVADHNVGLLTIDWDNRSLRATLHDASSASRVEITVALEALTF